MLSWLPLVLSLLTALPNLITGVEAAFSNKPKSGPEKWIAVETALASPISAIATEISKMAPDADTQKISASVAVFTKAANDAVVSFFNAVGWPVTPQPAA